MPFTLIFVSIVAFFVLVPSNTTSSLVPGTVSPLQLAASDQLLDEPPPSHVLVTKAASAEKRTLTIAVINRTARMADTILKNPSLRINIKLLFPYFIFHLLFALSVVIRRIPAYVRIRFLSRVSH